MKSSTPSSPPFMRKYDLLLILGILLIALLFWWIPTKDNGQAAVVRVDNQILHTLPLDRDTTVTVAGHGHHVTVAVKNRTVFVVWADCPDQLCRNTGTIDRQGQVIVCLPAHCSIAVEGTAPAYDAMTY